MVAKINPLNEFQFDRLTNSIDWSGRQLETPKKKRIEAIKLFLGYHYSDGGATKTQPVNFLKLAISIFVRLLAARAPRVLMSTKEPELKSTAANLELAINEIPKEIRLQATLKRLVTEALFSFGVAKVGLHTVGEMLGYSYGSPFVDIVTSDDYIVDMAAKHYDQRQYEGNDYWLDYKDVMESKWFENKNGLEPDEYTIIGQAGEERAEGIAVGESASLFRKKIWLRDVWLPTERLMVTYSVKSKRRMKTIEWTGPERGPYYMLGFDKVPGNLLPLPPVAIWRDLHELANALYRKLGDQADAQKTVQGFQGGNEESVESFKNAKDGDGITYHGAEPKILKAGGVDPTTLAFFLQSKDLASYFGGNWDSLGGLSPQAETLGQDKLLSVASGAQMRDMASEVVDFMRDIFRALAHYEWHDPVRRRQLEKSIPGTDLSVPVLWDQQARRGKFNLYDLDIDVYSLQDDSPGLKLQKLGVIMQQYVLPLLPMIQQIGGTFDIQKFFEDLAKFSDFPEMNNWIQFMQELEPTGGEETRMPADTTRTNVRINRPGATREGKDQILMQTLLGGRPQRDEMAAIGRPTG